MFRYQCGCYRVRLQFARPAGLSYKPVSYRRPQFSRQHYLDILKVQCIKLPKVTSCTGANFGISLAAFAVMVADFVAESVKV